MHRQLAAQRLLFVLMSVAFIFNICLIYGNTLYAYPARNAIIEILIIVLYAATQDRKVPYQVLIDFPLLKYLLAAWVAFFSARYLTAHTYEDIGPYRGAHYVLMLFHAFFALYAIDIFVKVKKQDFSQNRIANYLSANRQSLVFVALCGLTFTAAFVGGTRVGANANAVFSIEILFIALYMCFYSPSKTFTDLLRDHRAPVYGLLLLALVITVSFLASPYELIVKSDAIARYHQTLGHIAFFAVAFHFLHRSGLDASPLLLMIPLSMAAVSLYYIFAWHNLEYGAATPWLDWFDDPPLNFHIRAVGHIATASCAICFAMMLSPKQRTQSVSVYAVLLLISAAFLIWTGGRAAMLSIAGTLALFVIYVCAINKPGKLPLVFITLLGAVFVAESFKVFDWNGITQGVSRSLNATNLAEASTGRTQMYQWILESIEGHWLLGLGPQSYWYMPNRLAGLQPHNMLLQFLVEWGALGALLFIFLLLRAARKIFMAISELRTTVSAATLGGLAVWISLSIHGLVSGTYFYGQSSFYIALSLAISLATVTARPTSEQRNSGSQLDPFSTRADASTQ